MPKKTRTEQEKRAADDKILAFNYQWDFFLKEVFNLLDEESTVSFEYLDDVAKKSNDSVILYQVKHSIQKGADGNTIHLANRDNDIWKTLSVWIKFIGENKTAADRKAYIARTQFVLVTNKTDSNNQFISALESYHTDKNTSNFIDEMKKIIASGKKEESELNTIIQDFIAKDYLGDFIAKIQINLEESELQTEIKRIIGSRFALHDSKIEQAHQRLIGQMQVDANNAIRNREKIIYDCHTIQARYHTILADVRDKLTFRTDYPSYTGEPRDLLFIKQLVAVNDINNDSLDDIAQYTSEWFQFHNNFKDKWDNYDINTNDVSNLTSNVKNTSKYGIIREEDILTLSI